MTAERLGRLRALPAAARDRFQRAVSRAGFRSVAWRLGLPAERRFWDRYLGTRGLDWPEEYLERMDHGRPLDARVQDLVDRLDGSRVAILDVGSGPLTWLGSAAGDRPVEVVAVDPLARWYRRLYARHGIEPAVRPQRGRAETLSRCFPAESFDVVVARNALDHGIDPPRAVREMLGVTRPGGWVYLEHASREGANQRYRGLHQWDLFVQGDHLWVGDRRGARDLTRELAPHAVVDVETGADGWVRARIQKGLDPAEA